MKLKILITFLISGNFFYLAELNLLELTGQISFYEFNLRLYRDFLIERQKIKAEEYHVLRDRRPKLSILQSSGN